MNDVSGAGNTETIYVTHARMCNNRTEGTKQHCLLQRSETNKLRGVEQPELPDWFGVFCSGLEVEEG